MQAYELLVGSLLEREGFWVRQSFKVELTAEDKKRIGRPSSPRWEVDLIAYRPRDNLLRVIECKSYFDSRGVKADDLIGTDGEKSRYKLFVDPILRETVLARLRQQLYDAKSLPAEPQIVLCLAAGRVATTKDRERLAAHFEEKGWLLLDGKWAQDGLTKLADGGYDNSVATVTAKVLRPMLSPSR